MNTINSVYEEQIKRNFLKKPLLTVVDSRLNAVSYDMQSLENKSSCAAACLQAYGCQKGDRVLISLRSSAAIWSFFWGTLKLGAVPCVLFPGLGNGGLEIRLKAANACFFVTDIQPSKISAGIESLYDLKQIIIIDEKSSSRPAASFAHPDNLDTASAQIRSVFSEDPEKRSKFVFFTEDEWQPFFIPADVDPEDDAFIVFTSGTTGTPKPVVHRQGIADAVIRSMTDVLHAVPEDVYWCTAHPAWITGTVYGILGPVLCGIPSIQYDGNFHAKRWMPILQSQKVSLWYTAPTVLRALMREEDSFFESFDFSALKQIYSIGEPLGKTVFQWGEKVFSQPVYDTWFQTECGTIRIANQPGRKLIPGWMGKPVDDTAVFVTDENHLRLKTDFSSMFKGYWGMPDASSQKISGGFYETGDLVTQNEEGFLHFEGRSDDVINTSGHLVGPAEVEQVIIADPAVEAAAVIAEPDDLCYEVPGVYLVLAKGQEWSRQLETTLKVAVNNGVSSYAVPKYFHIIDELPLTESGKINRSALRKLNADNRDRVNSEEILGS